MRRAYIFGLLVAAVFFSYLDRQILAFLVGPIEHDLAVSDAAIGMLQGLGLNLTMGVAAIPLARVSDRVNRLRFLAACAAAWSLFTLLSALSQTYWQLFLCRSGVGLAEAGVAPAAYALISQLYPAPRQTGAMTAFFGATLLSASAGIALCGATIRVLSLAGDGQDWRAIMASAAVPGVGLALALAAVRAPSRRILQSPPAAQAQPGAALWPYWRTHWRLVVPLCLALVASSLGVEALLLWLPTILGRVYGLAPASAAGQLAWLYGAASVAGVAVAEGLRWALARGGARHPSVAVVLLGMTGSALAMLGLPFVAGEPALLVGAFVVILLTFVGASVAPSLVLGVAPPDLKAQVYAVWSLLVVAAYAVWPATMGALAEHVFHGPGGLLSALVAVAAPCGIAAPLLLVLIRRPLTRALDRLSASAPVPALQPS